MPYVRKTVLLSSCGFKRFQAGLRRAAVPLAPCLAQPPAAVLGRGELGGASVGDVCVCWCVCVHLGRRGYLTLTLTLTQTQTPTSLLDGALWVPPPSPSPYCGSTSLPRHGSTSLLWQHLPTVAEPPYCGSTSLLWQHLPIVAAPPYCGSTSLLWQ